MIEVSDFWIHTHIEYSYSYLNPCNIARCLTESTVQKSELAMKTLLKPKEKGNVTVETAINTKIISNVLFVHEIYQNLFSVGQLLETNYSLVFKDKACVIYDLDDYELMYVMMNDRRFVVNWNSTVSSVIYHLCGVRDWVMMTIIL